MTDILYGPNTALALGNLAVSRRTVGSQREFVAAFGQCKQAAARANARLGTLDRTIASAIEAAAVEVIEGTHDAQFPVDLMEGSGGTSTNMNFNEVIASRACTILGEPGAVHPNDHVNRSQSTNDVYPAAMKLAVHAMLLPLANEMESLASAFARLAHTHRDVLRLGRTCMQDAQPMTFGQLFDGWSAFVAHHARELVRVRDKLLALPLGGTAIGTGFGAVPGYRDAVLEELRALTGVAWGAPRNAFHAMQSLDAFVAVSSELKSAAASLGKIAQDLIILGSGPAGGIGELRLPAVQPGSSIMPGKVNPVVPMAVVQVAFAVTGNDVTITQAQQAGQLEINHYEPVVASRIFDSLELLTNAARLLREKCVAGIMPVPGAGEAQVMRSSAVATALLPALGYDAVSALVHESQALGVPFAQLVVQKGVIGEAELRKALTDSTSVR